MSLRITHGRSITFDDKFGNKFGRSLMMMKLRYSGLSAATVLLCL